jgi:hypothetical protein
MSLHLHHLHQHVTFTPVDPLGDGLREEILAEQSEAEAIDLENGLDEGNLVNYLESITADVMNDADEFTYSED